MRKIPHGTGGPRGPRRPPRWLLLRVAAQNLGRRWWRTLLLGLAVMLGVGIGFATFVAGSALRDGIDTSFARMGADLVVVPRATLVHLTSSLLAVQPAGETLDPGVQGAAAAIRGVARVAPQRVVPADVGGRAVGLIAFDPARDVSVLPWLDERLPGALTADGVIAGARVPGRLGERLAVCGRPMRVAGRLGATGVGPVDESYFVSFEGLAAIVAFRRGAGSAGHAPAAHGAAAADPTGGACPADLPLDRVSALLLRLSPGARPADVKFALARLPEVKIVEGNLVVTASCQALNRLLVGVAVFAVFQLAALVIVLALLFSAIVKERHREIGLLRALGARPGQVLAIVLGEAAIVTALGGIAGLAFGAALLLGFARSLGFYFSLLGIPFAWPAAWVVEAGAAGALVTSVLLGLIGAFVPAWQVRRTPPYELLRADTG